MRVSQKDLLFRIEHLNDITNNLYDFSLEMAYGGYKLASHKGSVDVLSAIGYTSRKDLYYNIKSFIDGIQYTKYTIKSK